MTGKETFSIYDLIQRIERVTQMNMNEYYITLNHHGLIYDDHSLQSALKTIQHNKIDLILSRKPSINVSLDHFHLRKLSIPVTDHQNNPIKPTVIRWLPSILYDDDQHYYDRRYSTSDIRNDNITMNSPSIDYDVDAPIKKKQRIMSSDHPRTLPIPLLIHNDTSHFHPLKKPSTAPSSPSISPFPRLNISLPTLSSITSSIHPTDPPHLAPIYSNTQEKTLQHNKRGRYSTKSSTNTTYLCEHILSNGRTCGQTFRRSYDLSRHQTIHLENRPFCYCHKCGKKFTRMDALRRHEKAQRHSSTKYRDTRAQSLV
ncbi:hypothetical protein BDB01DRAFT_855135 [Pilobolus umbonatus]|nr:hypothetical protein BDB01DRAFT_855135 [Pilobolus umbonatus]